MIYLVNTDAARYRVKDKALVGRYLMICYASGRIFCQSLRYSP